MLSNERDFTRCLCASSTDGVVECVHLGMFFSYRRHFIGFRNAVEPRVCNCFWQQFQRHQHRPLRLHGRAWPRRIGGRTAGGSDKASDDVFRCVSGSHRGLGAGNSHLVGDTSSRNSRLFLVVIGLVVGQHAHSVHLVLCDPSGAVFPYGRDVPIAGTRGHEVRSVDWQVRCCHRTCATAK